MSYDSPEQLGAFAGEHDVTYNLLSDADSAVIREFGILNTLISPDDPEQAAGRSFYGVPFPGVYVTDENGVVTEKFFHRHYATRESAGTIRDSALGEILARHEVPAVELGTDQVKISAFPSDPAMQFETQSTIHVRFELEEGLHMYGRPLPEGYIASEVTVPDTPGLRVGTVQYPATHPREFPSSASRSTSTKGWSTWRFPSRRTSRCSTGRTRTGRRWSTCRCRCCTRSAARRSATRRGPRRFRWRCGSSLS